MAAACLTLRCISLLEELLRRLLRVNEQLKMKTATLKVQARKSRDWAAKSSSLFKTERNASSRTLYRD